MVATNNLTLGPYNETFLIIDYNYTAVGDFTLTAYANASSIKSNWQSISTNVIADNLKAFNLTVLNATGSLRRVFEFIIENNSTRILNNIYWNLTISNEAGVDSTVPITLDSNKTARIIVEYNYTNIEQHTITAKVDPANLYSNEANETDNNVTVTN